MLFELKKIKPSTLAKIYGWFGLILGIITAIILFIVSLVDMSAGTNFMWLIFSYPPNMTRWAIILIPVFMWIFYYIQGGILALIYNYIAKHFGGVKLDFDKEITPVAVRPMIRAVERSSKKSEVTKKIPKKKPTKSKRSKKK